MQITFSIRCVEARNEFYTVLCTVNLIIMKEKLKVEITVTDEKFKVNDLVCDGIMVIKATPKLVDAQGLIGRRNWRKVYSGA